MIGAVSNTFQRAIRNLTGGSPRLTGVGQLGGHIGVNKGCVNAYNLRALTLS
jgi:hypothetical protein